MADDQWSQTMRRLQSTLATRAATMATRASALATRASEALATRAARPDGALEEGARAQPDDIAWCYRLFLGREPDAHGEHGYLALVQGDGITRDELIGYFISSPEFRERLVRSFGWSEGAPDAVEVGDLTYYVNSDDTAIGSSLKKAGAYEPEVTAMVRRHLRPGQRFVDVGAAFGYFATLAGTIVGPSGQVVAIEPGPQNQSVLLLNLAVNGVSSAEVHQMALSDAAGLFVYSHSGANGFISPFSGDPGSLASHSLVRAATLDSILGERHVDMIKIDVEGAEGMVIRGARSSLERSRPMLLMEFSPPSLLNTSGVTGEELLEDLVKLDYSLDVIDGPSGELRPSTIADVMRRFEATSGDHIDIVAWVPSGT